MKPNKIMKEEKGYFKMTITPMKVPKHKIVNWLFWNVYWKIWQVERIKILAWIFKKLADFIEQFVPETTDRK